MKNLLLSFGFFFPIISFPFPTKKPFCFSEVFLSFLNITFIFNLEPFKKHWPKDQTNLFIFNEAMNFMAFEFQSTYTVEKNLNCQAFHSIQMKIHVNLHRTQMLLTVRYGPGWTI